MCGLFQVIHRNRGVDRDRFNLALDSMRHRGPDDSGIRFHEWQANSADGTINFSAASGHRRLAILDLSERSRQPFGSSPHAFVYNGELYNYAAIKADLEKEGVSFETDGDTEVFYQSLLRHGGAMLPRFNGMWGFTLLDEANHTLLASRDRYGKKPLFFYKDDDTLCFSSTVRAIQFYLDQPVRLRRSALLQYLIYGDMFPSASDDTHFEGISQVLPGTTFRFDLVGWEHGVDRYFDAHRDPGVDLNEPGLLENCLTEAVTARLVSDRPVALLLSGGVDSSLILAVLHAKGLHEQVNVYMGDTGRSDDYAYASRCADQLGVKARSIKLDYGSAMFERLLRVCRHHEKAFPFSGNALAMPEMYEAIAADGIPVVLDGTGGDEFFGGYWDRHLPYAAREEWAAGRNDWIESIARADGSANKINRFIRAARSPVGLANWRQRVAPKLSYYARGWLRIPLAELKRLQPPDPLARVDMTFTEALASDVAPGGRLGEWVWHNDRNAMMSSVENRSPLLYFRLHAFLFSGYRRKYTGEFNKHELRQVFDAFHRLPTQWRSEKQGFRWDGRRFIRHNEKRILELIESSTWLDSSVKVKMFAQVAGRCGRVLRSTLAKRFLCIAGVEEAMRP